MFRLIYFIVAACVVFTAIASDSSAQQKYTAEEYKQAAEWAMWSGRITDAEYAALVSDKRPEHELAAFRGRYRQRARRIVNIVTHPIKAAKAIKVVGESLKKATGCLAEQCRK